MLGKRHFSPGSAAAFMALACLVTATACNPDSATTGPSGLASKDFASNLRLVSGDQQVGPIAASLAQPLVVRVVDAGGQPVQGATVSFSVRGGGGSINPAANISGADGTVSASWTMGTTLGENKAVAILSGAFLLDSALFKATATVGPPTRFTYVSGDSQTMNASRRLTSPIVVRVQDAFGNNLSGIRVNWQAASGNGSIGASPDTTGADGRSLGLWTLGTAATTQFSFATITGIGTLSFRATAIPDTGRRLTIASGNNQSNDAGATLTALRVTLTDRHGNPVPNTDIAWTDSIGGGGSVSPTTSRTDALGQATATWTLGVSAGVQALRATTADVSVKPVFSATSVLRFSDVIAGNFQACGIMATNQRVYCWGAGDAGQLGRGTFLPASAPSTPVATAADPVNGPFIQVRQLTGGRNSFCALSVARQMHCWGRVIATSTINNVATVHIIGSPTAAGIQVLPSLLAAGEQHLCVLAFSGEAMCTGINFSGELGDGTFVTPGLLAYPAVAAPFLGPAPGQKVLFSTIATGRQHTCAFPQDNSTLLGTGVLGNNLIPLCWGANSAGQIGNAPAGSLTNVNTPTFIAHPAGTPTGFDTTSLAIGGQHTCVLSAGAGWCWGSNQYGQLGKGFGSPRDSLLQPVAMPAGVTFARIFAGEYHTCAIAAAPVAGQAYCWGRNDYGQLGIGTTSPGVVVAPSPVTSSDGSVLTFKSLSVGEFFTCGVIGIGVSPASPSQAPGTAYCWGDNSFGQLGQGTTNSGGANPVPLRVRFQP